MLDRDTREQYDMFGVPVNGDDDYGDSWGDEQAAPQGTPGQAPQQSAQPQDRSNDEVRYQYWQSQHDQLKNQYSMLEQQNQAMAQRLSQFEQIMAQPEPEPEEEAFPDPPAAPAKPYGFSQQDAMSDPSSESARYMVAMNEYNATMNQYNLYKSQWLEAKQRDMMQGFQRQQQMTASEAQRRAEVTSQLNQVVASVQQKYGVDYDTAIDFVNTMSDNSSITIDNLFELYKMRKGGTADQARLPSGRYAPRPEPNQRYNPYGASMPSPEFQQRQRAQSIPPTMGVHNAQGNEVEDPMMAAFKATIAQSNRNNVF